MTCPDLLAVSGPVIDCFGAVLLVGNEWKSTVEFAKRVDPRFERLDTGLDTLCNEYEALEASDTGFDELLALVRSRPWAINTPRADASPARIEPPNDPDGEVSFIFESQKPFPNEPHHWSVDRIEERGNQKLQRWFIRRGVILLVFGFLLQILSYVLPFLF